MKKIFNKIAVLSFVLLLLACNSDYQSTFGFKDFVQWSTTSVNIDENAVTPRTITIQLVAPQRSKDLTIAFEVIATNAVEGIDYEFPSGKTLVIPANSSTATITFMPIDNNEIFESERSVTLSITSADNLAVDLGAKNIKITINEDDFWCPRNQLSNSINTETDFGYSSSVVSIEKSVTPDGCLQFDIIGGGGSVFATTDIKFNGVIIVEDDLESTTGTVTDGTFQFFRLNGTGPLAGGSGEPYSIIIANGTYDLVTGTLQFDYELYEGDVFLFPGTFVYDNQ